MQRTCLGILRFCLAAWVGIAVFFVMLVIDLRQSDLFPEETKFDHPRVLFPLYYDFEMALFVPALLCAFVGLWNERVGRSRKYTILLLVIIAAALGLWDYGTVYQELLAMMNGPPPLPPGFHALHRLSRSLNTANVAAIAAAAMLALIPEKSHRSWFGTLDLPPAIDIQHRKT
jgi:hypothetical protein